MNDKLRVAFEILTKEKFSEEYLRIDDAPIPDGFYRVTVIETQDSQTITTIDAARSPGVKTRNDDGTLVSLND